MRILGVLIVLACIAVTQARAQVVALGASNVRGAVPAAEAWPTLLEGQLHAKGFSVSVSNQGIFGDTSDGMLARLDSAAPQGTRVVILACCGNDNRNAQKVVFNTDGNVTEMVKRLRARGISVVFLGPPTLGEVASRSGARYCGRILAGVSAEHHVGGSGHGGFHADAEGNAIIAAHVLPCVIAALQTK